VAVKDRSIGPFYSARVRVPNRWYRHFSVGITQLIRPWRRGKAIALPSGPFKHALVIGWWRKLPKDQYQDWLGDEQWLGGHKLDTVTTHDISHWSRGPDEEIEEEEVLASQPGEAGAES
jgi:hypothetical protein